jgi:Gpi18-like mannosyltransferase
LGWSIILLSFQNWLGMRVDLKGPDDVLDWTAEETYPGFEKSKYYLSDPYMNAHVAWDSEYYLSIAAAGFDDPKVQAVAGDYSWLNTHFCTAGQDSDCYSLNYAFFPLYPWLMHAAAFVLRILPLGLTTVGSVTQAGVLVSLLGTLAAMLGLYALLLPLLGEDSSFRALFFMLIFPSGFFLAQVYTEGLFLGLTFCALALLRERRWGWSALLAALAAWTRGRGDPAAADGYHLVAG